MSRQGWRHLWFIVVSFIELVGAMLFALLTPLKLLQIFGVVYPKVKQVYLQANEDWSRYNTTHLVMSILGLVGTMVLAGAESGGVTFYVLGMVLTFQLITSINKAGIIHEDGQTGHENSETA